MSSWDAAQYLKFGAQRTQPSRDLAARIPLEQPRKIIDIGCGPGNSTEVLRQRFPQADILGVDSSPEMIRAAAQAHPEMRFQLCDAGTELGTLDRDFDVVFSNACIQWIPNHPKLLREMMQLLRPGGILAVQIPINQKEPIHQIIQALAAGEKWKAHFPSPRIFYQLTVSEYYDLLGRSRTALNCGKRSICTLCYPTMPLWSGIVARDCGRIWRR
ncbi:methyltransferase domain-containing protein [Ruminococcus sp.]|uniref:methyltransferase domain-containing protein n=1 Tax=Ruminococcus sp. TaxID=41978 RepID=UPI003079B422